MFQVTPLIISFFFSETDKILFSGDTLFSLGCGRVFEGSYEQMFNSLEKIKRATKKYKNLLWP